MRLPILVATVGALGALLVPPGAVRAFEDPPPPRAAAAAAVVVLAEGSVEQVVAGRTPALLEVGQEIGGEERVSVGHGSVLSLLPVEGEGAGRVARLRGPFEGTLKEFLAAAAGGSASGPPLSGDDLAILRRPAPGVLEGPGSPAAPPGAPFAPCIPPVP